MANVTLKVKHNLHELSPEDLAQYLRDVSIYIGLDPDLNGLDTFWMDNESGVGRSLVVYAKRGTAEILRNIYHINVEELTHAMVKGSIVFSAAGRGGREITRMERATGSKYIEGLTGRALDNGIMTASTRALRRLTMQFTTLGILDESEIVDVVGQPVNPAAGAQLAGSPVVIPPQPQVAPNNKPGIAIDVAAITEAAAAKLKMPPVYPEAPASATVSSFATDFKVTVDVPIPAGQEEAAEAAKIPPAPAETKVKKPRKSKNTVSLEVEPEVVNKEPVVCVDCKKPLSEHLLINSVRTCPSPVATASGVAALLTSQVIAQTTAEPDSKKLVATAPPPPPPPAAPPAADMPTKEQMDEYRKKIGVFTQQLPATPGLGSVQRMRAFITKMFNAPPQNLNAKQWQDVISWFDEFSTRNGVKGLLKFINDTLGDVPKS